MGYIVHKFGGSSLADAKKVNNIANIVKAENEVIVVSAIGKTTSKLQKSLNLAKSNKDYTGVLQETYDKHCEIIDTFSHCSNEGLKKEIAADIKDISRILATIVLTKTYADSLKNFVLGYGEIWSAKILTHCLQCSGADVGYIDASKVLQVDDAIFPVVVNWSKSREALQHHIADNKHKAYVITGFIAANLEGNRTILGLNCSDYSAAIFAKLLNAIELNIWTDVAGIFSANPQVVSDAKSLDKLSYKEALELAYFGASVVHPLTISPMMEEGTPIYIKSSFDHQAKGTLITHDSDTVAAPLAKGLTSIINVALLRIQGAGMIGVSSVSSRVFNTLERNDISVLMISQASSEYSICLAVPMSQTAKAVKIVEKEFAVDIASGNIERVRSDKNYALITAVGDGMISHPGSSAKMINALAIAGINIHAIAQGSSERSVTVTIKEIDESKALRAIHNTYYADVKRLAIAIIGAGNIGKELVEQLKQVHVNIYKKGYNLQLLAITNSKSMLLTNDSMLATEKWPDELRQSNAKNNFESLAEHLKSFGFAQQVVIDATANESVATQYPIFLNQGISVVTPNKYANTQSMNYYNELRDSAKNKSVKFLYETNVCAGLPIIKSIQELLNTGDQIKQITGVLSGTLSYIFEVLNNGGKFSDAVLAAYSGGYTEPDPREDLSGMDVARKTVILAREIGLRVDLDGLEIENLTPENLRECPVEEFLEKLPEYDVEISEMLKQKKGSAKGLHYFGSVNSNGIVEVSIGAYENDSPFATTSGTDNLVIIQSNRYDTQPLVIKGPGAGAGVTAAGVLGDILQLLN